MKRSLSLQAISIFLCLSAFLMAGCGRSPARAQPMSPPAAMESAPEIQPNSPLPVTAAHTFDSPIAPPTSPLDPPASSLPVQPALSATQIDPNMLDLDYSLPIVPKLQDVKYLNEIAESIRADKVELERLAENGFVVSDQHAWQRFVEAYGWIYWKDLPVLVTTDSILQTVHASYTDLLQSLERGYFIPQLEVLLAETREELVQASAANQEPALTDAYTDLLTYVNVALALLSEEFGEGPQVQTYVTLATAANDLKEVELFGQARPVDFTMFEPRGNYAQLGMQGYFRAMMWLALMDFRFTETHPRTSEQTLQPDMLAAAVILNDAIEDGQQWARWQQIDNLLAEFIGPSDNITLATLQQFMQDTGIERPADVLAADPDILLDQLINHDYGQQRITGQIIERSVGNASAAPIPRPNIFTLFGQRFSIDSHILGSVVYDRLFVDGKPVERALPSTMDLMYALGNDHALVYLTDELETYRYGETLTDLREMVDGQPESFWQKPVINQWLGMLRTLDSPTTDERFPPSMRTSAWSDKMLQTQLASWTQFRHDNLLYIKQSYTTMQVLCEYPAGYIEPYPAFYTGLHDYAQAGYAALGALDATTVGLSELQVIAEARIYFNNVMEIAAQLETLAEKELEQIAFSPDEELFLRSIMVQQDVNVAGCGGPTFEEMWDGWYSHLFFRKDESPALIADVHTNPNNDLASSLYPPRVLHAATGPVSALLFIVETDEGKQLYIGPAFSYYEVIESGFPPVRLKDEEWHSRLASEPYPDAPAWTDSFRIAADQQPAPLRLPGR